MVSASKVWHLEEVAVDGASLLLLGLEVGMEHRSQRRKSEWACRSGWDLHFEIQVSAEGVVLRWWEMKLVVSFPRIPLAKMRYRMPLTYFHNPGLTLQQVINHQSVATTP